MQHSFSEKKIVSKLTSPYIVKDFHKFFTWAGGMAKKDENDLCSKGLCSVSYSKGNDIPMAMEYSNDIPMAMIRLLDLSSL